MVTRAVTLSLVAAALLAWAAPALAHVRVDAASAPAPLAAEPLERHVLSAGTVTPVGVWTALAAAALVTLAIARRRRAVALLSVAVLLVIAFETGLHSVHHIGEPDSATCVVASASAQTGGVTIGSIAFDRPAEMATPVAVTVDSAAIDRLTAPDRGRAPPIV
jgi:hypothetical protein